MVQIINFSLAAVLSLATLGGESLAAVHVFEVIEETFIAETSPGNPYLDVDLRVTLKGPSGTYEIPAFWDGGSVFRARLVATKPGTWTWTTGNRTGDSGLDNQSGSFEAVAWSEAEKEANPNRRGFIRVASNHHTLEYADGTPFFYAGDTWWSALTKIYSWGSDAGLSGISFQDAIALRKDQGFNGLNIIACFPSDTLSGIWDSTSHGHKVAEDGSTPFEIRDPEDADHGVDYTRINPDYWKQADLKMEYLSEHGFVPYFETVRRHEQWYAENPAERQAFVNYNRYLWARYGCYNMVFSWVHWDDAMGVLNKWKPMVTMAYQELGEMPYGQPRTAMAHGSSLTTWCVEPYAVPIGAFDVHNVSNKDRNYLMHDWLRDIYFDNQPKPGLNVEPHYPGWNNLVKHLDEGIDDESMAQFQMYGSVLNGGFGGHSWGDAYYAGVASSTTRSGDNPVPRGDPHINGFNRWNASSMGPLKDFILDPGHDYRTLVPATMTHLTQTEMEWRVLALSEDKSQGLGFFIANRTKCDVVGLPVQSDYKVEWWNIDDGGWSNAGTFTTDPDGTLVMPNKPNDNGWAFRILQVL